VIRLFCVLTDYRLDLRQTQVELCIVDEFVVYTRAVKQAFVMAEVDVLCRTNIELMYDTVDQVPDVIRPRPMSGTCSDQSIHRSPFLGASSAAPSGLQSARISAEIDKKSAIVLRLTAL